MAKAETVVFGCPVRNRGWVIERSLRSALAQEGVEMVPWYLVNDSDDDTQQILYDQFGIEGVGHDSVTYESPSGWDRIGNPNGNPERAEDHMGRVFNDWTRGARARYPDAEWFLLLSSDVVLDRPDCVVQMLEEQGAADPFVQGLLYPVSTNLNALSFRLYDPVADIFYRDKYYRHRILAGAQPWCPVGFVGSGLYPRNALLPEHSENGEGHLRGLFRELHRAGRRIAVSGRFTATHWMERDLSLRCDWVDENRKRWSPP